MTDSRKEKKTIYQRIVEAAQKGKGVRLSTKETQDLAADDAISTRAQEDGDIEP